jgi:hypothetical protein
MFQKNQLHSSLRTTLKITAIIRKSTWCLFTYGFTAPLFLDVGRYFSFLILYTNGRTTWTGDQPATRPLTTHRTTQSQNKRTTTSMTQVGFEPTIPVFERAKTVHVLDRAARTWCHTAEESNVNSQQS